MQWQRIKDTLAGRLEHVGRAAADNWLFVNAVRWGLRSGARWHDLPERYGKYKSVHTRFIRWARSCVWERLFADLVRNKKSVYLMIDSIIARAHQQAAARRQKGAPQTRLWGFPRRSEQHQNPSAGRRRGRPDGVPVDHRPGRRTAPGVAAACRRVAEAVIADKGIRTRGIVAAIRRMGAEVVISSRSHWRVRRDHDRTLYKTRNRIERCFAQLKQFHRLATRYGLGSSSIVMVSEV